MFELSENIWATPFDGDTVTDGVKDWTDESKDYDPKNPQYSHFTQVVWKATTELGCAFVNCASGTILDSPHAYRFLVCQYNPGGNVIGEFEYVLHPHSTESTN